MIGRAATALVAVLATACGSTVPPAPSPSWAALEPGRPFDAATILTAMRESRRPGGVPDEVETPEIAAGIAETITTFDGEPWTTLSIGGSCGPATCTVDVSGGNPEDMGEDSWTFSVEPATGKVTVIDARLGSIPRDIAERADRAVRASNVGPQVAELIIGSVIWLPPPDGQLVLSYRSGNEEGSCQRDVTVDMSSGSVEPLRDVDC